MVNTNYSNRMMIISGPNGSGKTIYLKQNAIIIFLAHLGFFVPAEFAEVPLIDKIVIVEPGKSLYLKKTGFEAEMASLSRLTTPGLISNRTLVLMDELGSSVDKKIAQKILATTILYLSDNKKGHIRQNDSIPSVETGITAHFTVPLCIAVTHLTDIMNSRFVEENE